MKNSIKGVFSQYNKNTNQLSEIHSIFLDITHDVFGSGEIGEYKVESNDAMSSFKNVIVYAKQPDQEDRLYSIGIEFHADGHISVRGSWRIQGKYGEGEYEDTTLYFTTQEPSESVVARALSAIQYMDGPISAAVSRYIDENSPSEFEPSQ